MMQNFTRDVNPVLIKATFKRMAQVGNRLSKDDFKRKMANAVKVGSGARDEIDSVHDDYDVMAHGITREQFVTWAAAVFLNCDATEFIEGIGEMIKTDGADMRRPAVGMQKRQSHDQEEEQEPEEHVTCGPLEGLELAHIFDKLSIENALDELISQSRYSIWRSIKGREIAADMAVSSKLSFTYFASLVEHKRRQLSSFEDGSVESWPPTNTEGAKTILDEVYANLDSSACADLIRKQLVLEYIRQVNQSSFANKTLKDQMQGLVLAVSEVLVEKMSEGAYDGLREAYMSQLDFDVPTAAL